MNTDDVIRERIARAKTRAAAAAARRLALQTARQAGLTARHRTKLTRIEKDSTSLSNEPTDPPTDTDGDTEKEKTMNMPHAITKIGPYPVSREEAAELLHEAVQILDFSTKSMEAMANAGEGLTPASLHNHALGQLNLVAFLNCMVNNLRMLEENT